jgi:iron complex outermembrane recepter protein
MRATTGMTKRRTALWLGSSMLVLAMPALAQTATPAAKPTTVAAASEGGGLEEITVTAQKREESLQSVPISITAFSTKKLDQLHVQSFTDYAALIPSLSFQTTGPGTAKTYFRGVVSGGDGNHSGSQPSVGTYLDEQPITTIQGNLDLHIYDIARVEALAGPQGTLYGASAEAGVVRIITNKPELGKLSASYTLGANTTAHGAPGYTMEGFVNAPIADNAAVRLVGWYEHDGGYIDNVAATRTYPTSGITIDNHDIVQKDFNWTDTYGARAALKVDLGDNWTITPTIMGQIQKSNGVFGYDPAVGELEVTRFQPDTFHDEWGQAALLIEGKIGSFDVTYAGSYLKREIKSLTDYSDYTFFYDPYTGAYITDNDGKFITPSQKVIGDDHFSKQSHELRIQSDKANRFRFIGGLFFQIQKHHIFQDYVIPGLNDDASINDYPGTIWLTNQQRTDKDYAIFGEASFDILPTLTVTAGGRFYKYDNSLYGYYGLASKQTFNPKPGKVGCIADPENIVPGAPTVDGKPCIDLDKTVSDTGFLPKLNLTWNYSSDGLVYATYSKGYRPGGVNRNGDLGPYQADYLINYELGWKTSWMDNRLRFNGALFYEKWNNFQLSFLGQNSLTVIQNAGNADVKGIEGDVTWAPVNGLTINASATYLNAKLTSNYCSFSNADNDCSLPGPQGQDNSTLAAKGTSLPVTPDFKAAGTARYQWIAGGFDAHVQGTLTYQSSFYSDLRTLGYDGADGPIAGDRALIGKSDGYASVNFTAGIARGNWALELWGKNLFDVLGDSSRYTSCTTSVCAGNVFGTQINGVTAPGIVYSVPITPRQIGLQFTQKF